MPIHEKSSVFIDICNQKAQNYREKHISKGTQYISEKRDSKHSLYLYSNILHIRQCAYYRYEIHIYVFAFHIYIFVCIHVS